MHAQLQKILNTDFNKNIATLGFFKNYPISEFYIENNSAFIIGKSDHLWAHIICDTLEELEFFLSKYHHKTKYYFSVENWMIPIILKYGTIDWKMSTKRYIFKNENINYNLNKSVVKIDQKHASFIHENSEYKFYTSVEYIKERLSKDMSAGIIEDHVLAAWGFTHDDGSLGFLHVLDDYRKKGYGSDIVMALIHMKLKEKKPVFCNIEPDNLKAIKLVENIGLQFDRNISWLKLKQ
jgi:ribosomal protein S18 acetylase RimI-like enzyme